jgi:hypothetical protein
MAEAIALSTLVLRAVAYAPKAGRWLVRTSSEQREFSRLLQRALVRAVCPEQTDHPQMGEIVMAVNNGLNNVLPPEPSSSRVGKAIRAVTHTLVGRWSVRPPTTLGADDEHLFEMLKGWIAKAFEQDWPKEQLAAFKCKGRTPDVQTVVNRIPDELDRVVTAEGVTKFRQRLIDLIDDWRRRRTEVRRLRRNIALRDAFVSVVPSGATFAILEQTWDAPASGALAVLVYAGTERIIEAGREHGLFGLDYAAAKLLVKIDREAARGRGQRAPKRLRKDLRDLGNRAHSTGQFELAEALERLEARLDDWVDEPNDDDARRAVGEALGAVADVVLGNRCDSHA